MNLLSPLLLLLVVATTATISLQITHPVYSLIPSGNNSNNINNETNRTVANMTKADPSDIGDITDSLLFTDIVAQELSSANPSVIADYPLNDFSTNDITLVLDTLSTSDLEKVLNNIPIDVLQKNLY